MGRTRMGRTDGRTDGLTDGRTDGQGDDYMLPRNFSGSIKKDTSSYFMFALTKGLYLLKLNGMNNLFVFNYKCR